MSLAFGPVRQLGFVVRDLDAALRYWTETLGVGPFFLVPRVTPATFAYGGEPSPPPTVSIALANSGDVQIELIEQHDDRPSAYRDFLDSGREGFQHVSSWLTREAYDATRAKLLADGAVIAHEGSMSGSGVRWAYFATDSEPGGLQYEIADILDTPTHRYMQSVAEAAADWDGRDPIRNASA